MERNAYAKINLTLDLVGVRDGYHLLSSVFAEISLADTVSVLPVSDGFSMTCDDPSLPTDRTNLCLKAAEAFRDRFGFSGGLKIGLTKRIPSCAGLGGGSSDAAAVLLMMADLCGISRSDPRLAEVALRLGADVPFFLRGGCKWARGIGEDLTDLPIPNIPAVLVVKPIGGVNTARAFRRFDEIGDVLVPATPDAVRALRSGESVARYVSNSLGAAATDLLPEIAVWKRKIADCGALAAEMSGSGSAVFGLFDSTESANAAKSALNAPFAEVCTFVSRRETERTV